MSLAKELKLWDRRKEVVNYLDSYENGKNEIDKDDYEILLVELSEIDSYLLT